MWERERWDEKSKSEERRNVKEKGGKERKKQDKVWERERERDGSNQVGFILF